MLIMYSLFHNFKEKDGKCLKKTERERRSGSKKGCIHQGDRRKKTCCCKCNGSSIERNTKQEMKMFVNAFLIPEIFNSFSVPTNNKRKFRWDMTL